MFRLLKMLAGQQPYLDFFKNANRTTTIYGFFKNASRTSTIFRLFFFLNANRTTTMYKLLKRSNYRLSEEMSKR